MEKSKTGPNTLWFPNRATPSPNSIIPIPMQYQHKITTSKPQPITTQGLEVNLQRIAKIHSCNYSLRHALLANSDALVVLPQRARLGCSPDSALTQRTGLVDERLWGRLDYLEVVGWQLILVGGKEQEP